MSEHGFRNLSEFELSLLRKLSSIDFQGKRELVEQIENIEVKQTDEHGALCCLEFNVSSRLLLPMKHGCILQAMYFDTDKEGTRVGVVEILLHVVNYRLHSLEIYPGGERQVLRIPDLSELEIRTNFPVIANR